MNFEKLNQWLVLAANVGVLLGIFFLAFELQQNTQMMRTQTRDGIADKQLSFFSIAGSDLETSRIVSRGLRENAELDSAEDWLLGQWMSGALRMWENEWYQFNNGLFDEAEFRPRMELWARFLRYPRFRENWQNAKFSYSPSFREQMDSLLTASD